MKNRMSIGQWTFDFVYVVIMKYWERRPYYSATRGTRPSSPLPWKALLILIISDVSRWRIVSLGFLFVRLFMRRRY